MCAASINLPNAKLGMWNLILRKDSESQSQFSGECLRPRKFLWQTLIAYLTTLVSVTPKLNIRLISERWLFQVSVIEWDDRDNVRLEPVSVPEHGQHHREDEQKRNIHIQYSGNIGACCHVAPQHRVCMNHGMSELTNRNQWLLWLWVVDSGPGQLKYAPSESRAGLLAESFVNWVIYCVLGNKSHVFVFCWSQAHYWLLDVMIGVPDPSQSMTDPLLYAPLYSLLIMDSWEDSTYW